MKLRKSNWIKWLLLHEKKTYELLLEELLIYGRVFNMEESLINGRALNKNSHMQN